MGVSPMTELANNLCDTSLGITPILDSKVSSSAFTYLSQVQDAERSRILFATWVLFSFLHSTRRELNL
jgi:hypothetical protein